MSGARLLKGRYGVPVLRPRAPAPVRRRSGDHVPVVGAAVLSTPRGRRVPAHSPVLGQTARANGELIEQE